METRFPHQTLLCPGLESITGMGRLFLKDKEPTWYPEFARVLKESGTLTIWSEVPWINIEQIVIDSNPYFEVVSINEEVTRKELEEMGSFGCMMRSRTMEKNSQDKSDEVKKIILKKKKIPG